MPGRSCSGHAGENNAMPSSADEKIWHLFHAGRYLMFKPQLTCIRCADSGRDKGKRCPFVRECVSEEIRWLISVS
jgi:hypothetical protein